LITSLALYVCTLLSMSVLILKTLICNGFYPFRRINQGSYIVGVYGIHFRFYGLKPFLRINIGYWFHVVSRLIKHEQLIIFSFHEKFISHWCMTCPTISMEFLYFLRVCLFPGKWFPENHFPNFSIFVCH